MCRTAPPTPGLQSRRPLTPSVPTELDTKPPPPSFCESNALSEQQELFLHLLEGREGSTRAQGQGTGGQQEQIPTH